MGSNCVASTSIGCLFCCKGCSAEKVRNAFTFIPPPPSYEIREDAEAPESGRIVYLMDGLRRSSLYKQAAEAAQVRWLQTRKGCRVPMVWFRSRSQAASTASDDREQPLVLLHCHGNATDIGMMMGQYFELAKYLDIEVVGVEYSGYGVASGKPSSGNTYADAEAAYDHIVATGVNPKRIVAYGQSVGSGPVSCLAAKRDIGGIVLHSPLLSGIKVVDPQPDSCCRPSCVWHCFDFYPNDRRIQQAACPVFIMHGQRDDIIPFYHAYRLHQACPKASRWPPYFPSRAGHNDLVELDMRTYFREVASFLRDMKRIADGQVVEPPELRKPQQEEMGAPRAVVLSTVGSTTASSPPPAQSEAPMEDLDPKQQVLSRASPLVPKQQAEVEAQVPGTPDNGEEEARQQEADEEFQSPESSPAQERMDGISDRLLSEEGVADEAAAAIHDPAAPAGADDFFEAVPEPKAGPEDGRYAKLRQGDFRVPGGLGAPCQAATESGGSPDAGRDASRS